MKTVIAGIIMLLATTAAGAQSAERPRPKDSTVVDNILPPPVVKDGVDSRATPPAKAAAVKKDDAKPANEPVVSVRKDGETTIEEYRIRGRLYKQRVTPKGGPAYTLIDEKGEGRFTRVDGPELKYSVPMWVLLEW